MEKGKQKMENPPGLIALDRELRGSRSQLKKARPLNTKKVKRATVRKKSSQKQKAGLPEEDKLRLDKLKAAVDERNARLAEEEKKPKPSKQGRLKTAIDTFLIGAGPSLLPGEKKKERKLKDLPFKEACQEVWDTYCIGQATPFPERELEKKKQEEWEKTGEKEWLKKENEQNLKKIQELQEEVDAFSFSPASSEYQPRDGIGAGSENLIEAQQMEILMDKLKTIEQATMASFQQALVNKLQAEYFELGPNDPKKPVIETFLQNFVPIQIVQGPSLKLSSQTLPIFSGNVAEYFDWKNSVQEILACTKTSAAANLVAVKYSCFKEMSLKNAVRTVKTLSEMFSILDARFGSKTAHASRISNEISALKCITTNNFEGIISFVEQFENSRRQAENSNISECFINLPVFVDLTQKLSIELLNEFLSTFPTEDLSVEMKMQNMQKFLSEIKDRAIQAKNFRNPDNSKTQKCAKINLVSVDSNVHVNKNAENQGGGGQALSR